MTENEVYNKIFNSALFYSNLIVKNQDEAKDIAQSVTMEYLFIHNKDKIKKLDSWIFITSRNKSYNYLKSRKKDLIYKANEFKDKITKISSVHQEDVGFIEKINCLPNEIIKSKERKLIIDFYKLKCDLKKLAKKYRLSYQTIRKKIYRIKSEISAYSKKEMGYNNSLEIAGPKLRESIYNFIKKFKKCCENNDIDSMSGYFGDCNIPKKKNKFDISEIVKYRVDYEIYNNYTLWVTYFDSTKQVRCLITEFIITPSNNIRITKYPKLPKKIIKIENKAIPKHIDNEIMPDRKGIYHKTASEVEDLISDVEKEIIFEKK
ncbi:MAG: sigma-70 family RNA polymerase sigma factor [Candidatus Cloacimonetes bacterium]|nr:sigma-70 family RNA polymerase sigma factor [Candidatus Cloacimonadota bacterium]MCF7814587.1 sigma-70 family RNA polymerase sigma factor [Candidatus Cloacimonadota bacterium]MCF7869100.1 sigma-70 family RNA polymerase sigma factor [Candidatus Cloacimonadota bacterium]MCF7884517.1 sigma-70 family RNA polymerase sigma factor [Candidatus Cloacimonadota bacterium]